MKADSEENISKRICCGSKVGYFSDKMPCFPLLAAAREGCVHLGAVGCAAHMCTEEKANAEVRIDWQPSPRLPALFLPRLPRQLSLPGEQHLGVFWAAQLCRAVPLGMALVEQASLAHPSCGTSSVLFLRL